MCDVIDKNHICPLQEKMCDSVKYYSGYVFWPQLPVLKNIITMCQFKGCSAELKQHQLTCKRQCLNCEEFILLDNMQKHLKQCQPHLNASGVLNLTWFYKL